MASLNRTPAESSWSWSEGTQRLRAGAPDSAEGVPGASRRPGRLGAREEDTQDRRKYSPADNGLRRPVQAPTSVAFVISFAARARARRPRRLPLVRPRARDR